MLAAALSPRRLWVRSVEFTMSGTGPLTLRLLPIWRVRLTDEMGHFLLRADGASLSQLCSIEH